MRLPDSSPILDKNRAPMGPEILSSTGAGVWRKAPTAFSFIQCCTSVCDRFRSGRTDPVQFKGLFKEGPILLLKIGLL